MTRPTHSTKLDPDLIAEVERAEAHLSAIDPLLGAVISDLGPCPIVEYIMEPFDSLVWTVVGQQISSAAAAAITNRLRDRVGGLFTPDALNELSENDLREAGLSRSKVRTIQALSAHLVSGELDLNHLAGLPDAEIMKQLTPYYGIGPWTVEMLLIFGFGRMDVFSGGDLALRKAIGLLHDHDTPPDARQSVEIARQWAPYRTVASWYLWRTVDPLA